MRRSLLTSRANDDERGTGVVGTAFGAVVFLAFLLLATHVLLGLYSTSVLTSVAWDDAKLIADNPNSQSQADIAQTDAQRRLSGFKNVKIQVSETATDVAFHVTADRPNFLPAALAAQTHLNVIDRTVHVRPEQMQ